MSHQIQQLADVIVHQRRLRTEMEEQIKHRCDVLAAHLKANKMFSPPPKGQKSPLYVTADGATKVRLMLAGQNRQWHQANDPLILDTLRAVKVVGMSPEEVLLSAAKFDTRRIEAALADGRITEAQRTALLEIAPTKEWRVSVTQSAQAEVI